jgi:hypothetical protein
MRRLFAIVGASRRRKLALLVGAMAGALAATGLGAYAAAKDTGTIHACALKQTGQLRLDTGSGCLPSERALQWNQTGPPGPPGPPGNTDSTVRNMTGFILDGQTASSPVLSGAGQLGTLSFTCRDVTYMTNTADTNTFGDRVRFYSPQVPNSPLAVTLNENGAGDHLTVPWSDTPLNRWFQILIEGMTGSQTQVTLTTITGWAQSVPEDSGCAYYAYIQTSDVRSQQTVTP